MATLKISDRDEVLRRVLAETFAPRFAEVKAQIDTLLWAELAEKHPRFLKMFKDVEARAYLAFSSSRECYFILDEKTVKTAEPKYGKGGAMPTYGYLDRDVYQRITTSSDIHVPTAIYEFKISDKKTLDTYRKAWSDYAEAREKLSALLNSYIVREKFEVDFPEFAKYIPAIEKKASLPVVIIKNVRKELSKLGVPAK